MMKSLQLNCSKSWQEVMFNQAMDQIINEHLSLPILSSLSFYLSLLHNLQHFYILQSLQYLSSTLPLSSLMHSFAWLCSSVVSMLHMKTSIIIAFTTLNLVFLLCSLLLKLAWFITAITLDAHSTLAFTSCSVYHLH